ncbi:MAG: ATP-grasp domain-containing protein [Magnetovibrio sp.]|nr:ATP-grasp domain-containing protein [Magnetovibrio sp.]
MSHIVIIGGGKSQLPFIRAAQDLGFRTIVFDLNADCPGATVADLFYIQSIRETTPLVGRIRTLSKDHDIAGVMTYSAHEHTLMAVALACEHLGLPSFSTASLATMMDKTRMKTCFTAAGIPTAQWLTTDKFDDAATFVRGPIIVKPAKGAQGSQGVALVENTDELRRHFDQAAFVSTDGKVVLEEYLQGPEYSVDGIIINGTPHTLSLRQKHSLGAEHGFVMSGFTAAPPNPILEATALQAVGALDLNNSMFSIDVIDSPQGPKIIECGVMLDCKIDRLLYFDGIDIYKILIQLITGYEPTIDNTPTVHDLRFMFAQTTGTLNILAPDTPGVEWEQSQGSAVTSPKSISDVIGWVIGEQAYISTLMESDPPLFEVQ